MYRHESLELHKITRSPAFRLVPTEHADKQMVARNVTAFEAEKVAKSGSVVMIETDPDGSERWRVAGRDADGRRIEIVVEPLLPAMLVLVTVIRVG